MGRIFRCTVVDCSHSTVAPLNRDPRKRWILNLELLDSEGCMACDAMTLGQLTDLTHTCIIRKMNICPSCAATLLNLTEEHYRRLEKAEEIARGKRPASELVQ